MTIITVVVIIIIINTFHNTHSHLTYSNTEHSGHQTEDGERKTWNFYTLTWTRKSCREQRVTVRRRRSLLARTNRSPAGDLRPAAAVNHCCGGLGHRPLVGGVRPSFFLVPSVTSRHPVDSSVGGLWHLKGKTWWLKTFFFFNLEHPNKLLCDYLIDIIFHLNTIIKQPCFFFF